MIERRCLGEHGFQRLRQNDGFRTRLDNQDMARFLREIFKNSGPVLGRSGYRHQGPKAGRLPFL